MMKSICLLFLLMAAVASGFNSSCKEILETTSPRPRSGIYTLQDAWGVRYQTYCDMLTDGGGWTLVSSVHENNAQTNGRCVVGDRWSSEHGSNSLQPTAENWMNHNTFGSVVSATADDFKNPGYFDIAAKNLMIWQVPNDTPYADWRKASYLKYRTNSDFFDLFGGNLYYLYKYYFPIVSNQFSWPSDYGPAIPVVFDEGDGGALVDHFGPSMQTYLTPGYIQFRAVNSKNNAYAMCPGVKVSETSANNQHACLGSTGYNYNANYCGDFAGWSYNGYGTHSSYSVDKFLIESTFLMFYR